MRSVCIYIVTCFIGLTIVSCSGGGGSDNKSASSVGRNAISVGGSHSCALGEINGSVGVKCWGMGTSGQLGNGEFRSKDIPVIVLALEDVGINSKPRVSGGESATGAEKSRGDAEAVDTEGDVDEDVEIEEDIYLRGIVELALGDAYTCALGHGGYVFCWGSAANGAFR